VDSSCKSGPSNASLIIGDGNLFISYKTKSELRECDDIK
jgi:hypothetical protein